MVIMIVTSPPNMPYAADISTLNGYLTKESAKPKLLGSSKTTRYFVVEEITGTAGNELALCYYKHKNDKEPNGWFFLKDVTDVEEDTDYTKGGVCGLLVVNHPARMFRLHAPSLTEHKLWMDGMVALCDDAVVTRNGVEQPKKEKNNLEVKKKKKGGEEDVAGL